MKQNMVPKTPGLLRGLIVSKVGWGLGGEWMDGHTYGEHWVVHHSLFCPCFVCSHVFATTHRLTRVQWPASVVAHGLLQEMEAHRENMG